ncbi:unnamed protein product [Phytomonas sp. Hart1]|nr:unnamed protein product [Phytomonas sp. Hart1]|eukprot:CCW68995.1 unnamed protein product [Phytomonas sp. isolate Hart1]
MEHRRWPSAPVGRCGFHGTTSLDPYPDRLPCPSRVFVDTPGYCYEIGDGELLQKLVEGLPWKMRLVGMDAISLDEVKALVSVPSNRCCQCVVVIPATDLVEDVGWVQNLLWQRQYIPARDVEGVVSHLKKFVTYLQALPGNIAAFIVISKMDKVGGCENRHTRRVILDVLETCIPINHIFFSEFPVERGSVRSKSNYLPDNSTRESLRQLHEELYTCLDWMAYIKSK